MVEDAKKRRLTRRKSVGGGRGSATPSKETDRSSRRRGLPRGLKKEVRHLLQKHHTADGHHYQAVSEDGTGNEVTVRSHLRHGHHGQGARRSEEHERTDASVQRGSPGSWQRPHTGTTSDLGMGRFDCGSAEAGNSDRLDGMSTNTKCDHARFFAGSIGRTSSHHSGSGVRDPIVSASQQLGGARKYGRAPPTQLSREFQP